MDKNLIILVKKPSPQQMLVEDNVNKPDLIDEDELMHFGVLGMKWGVRRYQNKDGTLTALGKAHLATLRATNPKKAKKFETAVLKNTEILLSEREKKRKKSLKKAQKVLKKKRYYESDEYKRKQAKKAAREAKAERNKELKRRRKMEEKEEKRLQEIKESEIRKQFKRQQKVLDKENLIRSRKKKRIISMGPSAVARNLELFNDKELERLYNRFSNQEKLKQIRSDTHKRRQQDINRWIKYGDTINNIQKFMNTPMGQALRKTLGDEEFMEVWPKFLKNKKKNN